MEPTSQLQRLTWSARDVSDILYTAAAQSAAGFRSPDSFRRYIPLPLARDVSKPLHTYVKVASRYIYISMVAQVGQPSGWPVS
ncbi:ash family protein [Rahnella aquatilis]|uniref:ash family protein n=1 Tax=Rahnella aquatilis TaxID=34038 RepID=UPI0012E01A35